MVNTWIYLFLSRICQSAHNIFVFASHQSITRTCLFKWIRNGPNTIENYVKNISCVYWLIWFVFFICLNKMQVFWNCFNDYHHNELLLFISNWIIEIHVAIFHNSRTIFHPKKNWSFFESSWTRKIDEHQPQSINCLKCFTRGVKQC